MAGAQAPEPLDEFVEGSTISAPILSPSGRYLAFAQDNDDTGDMLVVQDLESTDDNPYQTANFGELDIRWIDWANDERLLVSVRAEALSRIQSERLYIPINRVLSVSRASLGEDAVILFDGASRQVVNNYYNRTMGRVTDILPDDDDHILMPAYEGDDYHLWRANLTNGRARVVERGSPLTVGWFTNSNGAAVLRVDVSRNNRRVTVYARSEGERSWDRVASFRRNEMSDAPPEFDFAGRSDDPDMIYVFARPEGDDRLGVHEFYLDSREFGAQVGQSDRYDVTRTMIDRRTREYLGFAYFADRLEIEYSDPDLARHYRGLESFFDGDVSILPGGFHGDRMIIYATGPQEAGVYYLYDRAARSIDALYPSRPLLTPDILSPVEVMNYQAEDGTDITAYLTVPSDGMGPETPLIVLPHGGPESRDHYGFDTFAQFYAAHGYAVFQPNFRGSSGYGAAFTQAGHGEWGQAMQTDIDSGVRLLIAAGRIDPGRICIAGLSYGGYAALMGGAQSPDLYRCVFAGASVTDLPVFLNGVRDDEEGFEYWRTFIGDPRDDYDRLYFASPTNLADRISVPVLLVHGREDGIVPIEQSRLMAEALEAAEASFLFDEFEMAGHSFYRDFERRSLLWLTLAFFELSIGDDRVSSDRVIETLSQHPSIRERRQAHVAYLEELEARRQRRTLPAHCRLAAARC